MLLIRYNSKFQEEKAYILSVILTEWLGLQYEVGIDDSLVEIYITLPNKQICVINADFWNNYYNREFTKLITPTSDWEKHQLSAEEKIPVLFGDNTVKSHGDITNLGLDIFGTCFFMLSRLEEAVVKNKDKHQRFPASESIAFKNDFLERPIVDEYVEILWGTLKSLDPSLVRKKQEFRKFITCDVDWPFDPVRYSFQRTVKSAIVALVKRRNFVEMFVTIRRYVCRVLAIKQKDNYRDSIDWMMDVNEAAGNKVAFYFIPLKTSNLDSKFCFNSEKMRSLFREIARRGHEIGIHPGYKCFNDQVLFEKSVVELKRVLEEEGIEQSRLGGRMHYLRWDVLETPQLWESNDVDYDSTLSFADKSGFRCGTSREFSMFDLKNKRKMKLKQRPLINMECTVISDRYEGLGCSELAKKRFEFFKQKSTKHNGVYTLLWHNSYLETPEYKELYLELI